MPVHVVSKEYREKGGKYVNVEARITEDCRIEYVRITGDFFAYPPEVVDEIEEYLRGKELTETLIKNIEQLIDRVEFAGINKRGFLNLLFDALKEASKSCREGVVG